MMFLVPLMCIWVPKAFLSVSSYDFVIEELNTSGASSYSTNLPLSEKLPINGSTIRLHSNLRLNQSSPITSDAIYIPFYEGRLKFFVNGTLFFDSDTEKFWQSGLRISDALIKLPKMDGQSPPDISFSIEGKGIGSITLSKIYFGQEATLATFAYRNSVYYENMRAALWGAEIFIFIVLITLFTSRSVYIDVIPPILIIIGLLIGGVGIFGNAFPYLISALPYLFTLMSLSAFGLNQFGDNIFNLSGPPINKLHLCLAIAVVAALLMFGSKSVSTMQLLNLYLTLPSLLFIILYVAAKGFYRFFFKEDKNSGIYFIGIISVLITLGHDAAYRFGLINDGVILVHSGMAVVIICVGVLYFNVVSQQKRKLVTNNLILEKEQAKSQAMLKVHSELHDGVLNYLSIVNILSREKRKSTLEDIQKISRFAINEIRIILSQKEQSEEDLLTALATLRQQVTGYIPSSKVDINWSIITLMDYPKRRSSIILEITRIIQEALHNAIVRAECKTLVVSATKNSENQFSITIENSGGKMFEGQRNGGFGINNIKMRAKRINAKVDIVPIAGGAILTINLP